MCTNNLARLSKPLLFGLIVFISTGCGPSTEELDEAYEVGFDLGLAVRCTSLNRGGMPAPSAYDDSLGRGELARAFRNGYSDANSISDPCRCE